MVQGESKLKKILITGANSYIGTSFEKWMEQYGDEYSIDTIDLKDETWREKSFTGYDVCFHVAGIAHVKETKENAHLYYKVNRDLAIETAIKAKKEGVSQFILLSSMSVYGKDTGIINKSCIPHPESHYGKSKLDADNEITKLSDNAFRVVIIRPPMVYGHKCKGNYALLADYSVKLPFFPDFENKRSMIYIDNLNEFVRKQIDIKSSGIFLPQNNEYVCTSEMVNLISTLHGRKIRMTKVFNPVIRIFITMDFKIFTKIFGNLIYETEDIATKFDFEESIINTERT